MSEVLKLQKDIDTFYEQKREISALKNSKNRSVINFEKMTNLKKEVSKNLSDILLTHGEKFLNNSFLFQVNNIEQGILEVMADKEVEQEKLLQIQQDMFKTGKEAMKYLYSIDMLENSINMGYGMEKRLLDIKDAVQMIDMCRRRECAVQVIRDKFAMYQRDFVKLIQLVKGHRLKEELSFQKKQEILVLLSELSLHDGNSIKDSVFYEQEDTQEDKLAVHYLYLYENIFLSMCKDVGICLNSYYEELKYLFQNNFLMFEAIVNRLDFMYRNYEVDIDNFERKQIIKKSKKMLEVKELLGYCCTFEVNMNLDVLLEQTQKDHQLPGYIKGIKNERILEGILFDLDIQMKDNIELCGVLDDIRMQMEVLFEQERYLDIFGFNMKHKNRQLNAYRDYYAHLLQEAKDRVKEKYLQELDQLFADKRFKKYTTITIIEKLEKLERERETLKEALRQTSENFREFDKRNRYLYIKSIQDRYGLDTLCDLVVSRKRRVMNSMKSRSLLQKEKEIADEFFYQEKLEELLRKEILVQLFGEEPELRGRILTYIKTNKKL